MILPIFIYLDFDRNFVNKSSMSSNRRKSTITGIMNENFRLLNKLKNAKSNYKVKDWENQRHEQENMLDSIWAYPHIFKKTCFKQKLQVNRSNELSKSTQNLDIKDVRHNNSVEPARSPNAISKSPNKSVNHKSMF